MIAHRRFLLAVLPALVIAACGGAEDRTASGTVRAAESTDTVDTADTAEQAVPDSAAELPPGLAPVAIDADVPTGPAYRPAPPGEAADHGAATGSAGRDAPIGEPRPVSSQADDSGSGQQQDEGAAILRRAAAAYENVRSMRADFVMQFSNPILRQQTTSRGTLYQQRPDRIALRFSDPEGDVILSDGEHFFVFQPSVDAHQATRSPASAGGGGGVDLQAQFVGNPTERFTWTLGETETVAGRPARAMLLVPRQRAEYRSLKVWFDAEDSLARRFEITEHNSSVRRFDLNGLRINTTLPDGVFRFTPPAGVRIVNVG